MQEIKEEIITILKEALKTENIELEVPPKSELGDYAIHCYKLAKLLGKEPKEIITLVTSINKSSKLIQDIKQIGPYINFFIDKIEFAKLTMKKIWQGKDTYGSSNIGKNKKVIIEHTSINPNASPHVGRARNAILGDSLARLLRFQGYAIETHYFVNDVGKQIALLVLGCMGKRVDFDSMLKVYMEYNKKMENAPEIEKEVLRLLGKLEAGDKKVRSMFKRVVDICVKGQTKILSNLGIKFDYFDYESEFLWGAQIKEILRRLERTDRLFQDEEGRFVLNQDGYGLAMKSPVLVLTRADKTSLYPLRDIAYSVEKAEKGFDRNLIVLGEDQRLYFQQISVALELLHYKPPEVVHYSFVLLQELGSKGSNGNMPMSTRDGNIVLLETFMDEATEKAKKEIQMRAKLSEKSLKSRARIIANSAVKYAILRVSPEKNVLFNLERALIFEGDTGPYLQYAYARISGILRKYRKEIIVDVDYSLLSDKSEAELIKVLAEFPETVEKATNLLRPHLIANYSYHLSQKFNEFYHICPVLSVEPALMKARLLLISCVRQVLRNSLGLLGIETLDRM